MNRLKNLTQALFEALAPRRCIECDALLAPSGSPLCGACERALPRWRAADGCPRCGTPRGGGSDGPGLRSSTPQAACPGCFADGSPLHVCHTLVRYEGPIRRWIPGFKSARSPFGPALPIRLAIDHLALELGRRLLAEAGARPDLVMSIPLYPRRRRRRGFNHADPIARRIAGVLERPWRPDGLERIRETRTQAALAGPERRANVRGAFRATSGLEPGARIWLVDDVLTTGSTLDSAADALLEAGALEVHGLTLAATVPSGWASRVPATYHPASKNGRRPFDPRKTRPPKVSGAPHDPAPLDSRVLDSRPALRRPIERDGG
jgi:ComF family protein